MHAGTQNNDIKQIFESMNDDDKRLRYEKKIVNRNHLLILTEKEKNDCKILYSFSTIRDHFQHISHALDLIVFFNSKVISPPIFR